VAIRSDDPSIIELARDIKQNGIQDELLVNRDKFLISGHRRLMAARIAGLTTVPVRVVRDLSYADNHEEFLKRLVGMNSQRDKSVSDMLHEEIIKTDTKNSYQQIKNARLIKSKNGDRDNLSVITPTDSGGRCKLSSAKWPLLQAIVDVVDQQREYWPITVRQVFYRLLGPNAPLLHASKKTRRISNDNADIAVKSYRAVVDVVARGRIEGYISWAAIEDPTRPLDLNKRNLKRSHFVHRTLYGGQVREACTYF